LLEVAHECSSYKIHYAKVELGRHVHGSLANIWHLKSVQYMELGFPCDCGVAQNCRIKLLMPCYMRTFSYYLWEKRGESLNHCVLQIKDYRVE